MTAPDLTAMLRDTLAMHHHAGHIRTIERQGWTCICGEFLPDEGRDVPKWETVNQHQATALAATVRNWLGNDETRELLSSAAFICWAEDATEPDIDTDSCVDSVLAAMVQQIGDGQ